MLFHIQYIYRFFLVIRFLLLCLLRESLASFSIKLWRHLLQSSHDTIVTTSLGPFSNGSDTGVPRPMLANKDMSRYEPSSPFSCWSAARIMSHDWLLSEASCRQQGFNRRDSQLLGTSTSLRVTPHPPLDPNIHRPYQSSVLRRGRDTERERANKI